MASTTAAKRLHISRFRVNKVVICKQVCVKRNDSTVRNIKTDQSYWHNGNSMLLLLNLFFSLIKQSIFSQTAKVITWTTATTVLRPPSAINQWNGSKASKEKQPAMPEIETKVLPKSSPAFPSIVYLARRSVNNGLRVARLGHYDVTKHEGCFCEALRPRETPKKQWMGERGREGERERLSVRLCARARACVCVYIIQRSQNQHMFTRAPLVEKRRASLVGIRGYWAEITRGEGDYCYFCLGSVSRWGGDGFSLADVLFRRRRWARIFAFKRDEVLRSLKLLF